jgi:hypothetical protein
MITRVHGPYQKGKRWRIVTVYTGGKKVTTAFRTEADALTEIARQTIEIRSGIASDVAPDYIDVIRASAIRLPEHPTWIYFLHGERGEVIYIGATARLSRRIDAHRENGIPFSWASWVPQAFERRHARVIERMLISRLAPKLNQQWRLDEGFPAVSVEVEELRDDDSSPQDHSCAKGDSNPHGVTH